jgi:membrane protein implicated in regulation of membrane protease activity
LSIATWQLWCIAAVLLLVVEMFTRKLRFLGLALAAAAAGVAGMAASAGWPVELGIFVVGGLLSLRLIKR